MYEVVSCDQSVYCVIKVCMKNIWHHIWNIQFMTFDLAWYWKVKSSYLECLSRKGLYQYFTAGGTLSPSVSDLSGPRGPYFTDGPVGHPGTLSSSNFEPALLLDPGGMSPSSDLAGSCSRLSLLAPLASGQYCSHLILTRLVRMACMVLMVPLAILGRCHCLRPRTRYWRILVGRLPRPTLPGWGVLYLQRSRQFGGAPPASVIDKAVMSTSDCEWTW